jgi:hypothetical protein
VTTPLGPLEEWISQVQARLDQQAAAIDGLHGQISELRQQISDLDRRLTKIFTLLDDQVAGRQSEEGMLHHTYAREYVSLVEQQILALAVAVFRAFPDATPAEKANFVAFACSALFGAEEAAGSKFIDALSPGLPDGVFALARQICEQAHVLRSKVTRGRPQRWSFDFVPGAPLDPETQLPWAGSAEGGGVAFVVAPAYVVESGALLAKQRVFTVPGQDIQAVAGR